MPEKGLVPQARVDGLEEEIVIINERINSKQDIITGAASTVTDENLSENKVVVSSNQGKIIVSNITTNELNNLSGSTSNIQTQINNQNTRVTALETNADSLQTQIDNKMKLVNGTDGEVIYFNETNEAFSQTIMNEGLCCLTEEEVNLCKNNPPSFRDVFERWKKFLKCNNYYSLKNESFSGFIDESNLDIAWQVGADNSGLDPIIFENNHVVGGKNCKTAEYDLSKIPSGTYNIGDLYIISSDNSSVSNPDYAIYNGTSWEETNVTSGTVRGAKNCTKYKLSSIPKLKEPDKYNLGDLYIINSDNPSVSNPVYAIYNGTSWEETNVTSGTVRGAKNCIIYHYNLFKIPVGEYNIGDIYTINHNTPNIANSEYAIYTGTKWVEMPNICEMVLNCTHDLEAWEYVEELDTIRNTRNTAAPNGYISDKKYSSYDITARCYSTDPDDDTNGLVACCAYDSNGVLHTLSFLRSPYANTNYKNDNGEKVGKRWVCILDYGRFDLKDISVTEDSKRIIIQKIIADKTDEALAYYDAGSPGNNIDSSIKRGWNTPEVGIGTVINITRDGNIITGACSQFNSTEIDENTRMVIDLDEMSEQYPVLNLFKGSSKWGYTTMSQANSSYENIQLVTPDLYIYDIPNEQVLYYDKNLEDWVADPTKDPYKEIGAGRLSYNYITKKLFYNGGTYITEVESIPDGSGSPVTIGTPQTITALKQFTVSPIVPTPSDDDDSQKIATTSFVRHNASSRIFGEIVTSTIPLQDAALHSLDGGIIEGNGVYSDFVTYMEGLVSSNPELFTTEENWQTSVNTYGSCDKFVYIPAENDIPAKIRLPKRTSEHGNLIKSYSEGTEWYRIYQDGWCEQGGVASVLWSGTDVELLKEFTDTNYTVLTCNKDIVSNLTINAYATPKTTSTITLGSGYSGTSHPVNWYVCGYTDISNYQTSQIYEYIVLATHTKTNIQVNIDRITYDLNNKVDKSELTTAHVVIDTYLNGTNWYRLYDDGWLEQGGITTASSSSTKNVILLKPYLNTDYTVVFGNSYTGTATSTSCVKTSTKTSSSFDIFDATQTAFYTYWQTSGQGA